MRFDTPRGRFEARRYGAGRPTALALHPLALSGELWSTVDTGEVTLLGLDARGHGSSDWDGTPFSVEDMAADAAAVIEAAGTGPMDVIGMSMGASTALVLAAERPDLVRRLVVADGTGCYGPDRVERWEERAQKAQSTARDAQLEFQRDRWFGDRFREEHPDTVDAVCRIFLATDGAAHAAACRALGGLDATGAMKTITAPTLVLVGEEDYATPVAMAEEVAASVPDSQLVVRPGTRHLSLVEDAEAWRSVTGFLTGQTD
jgi:3-oxoadipate enol-lactonase